MKLATGVQRAVKKSSVRFEKRTLSIWYIFILQNNVHWTCRFAVAGLHRELYRVDLSDHRNRQLTKQPTKQPTEHRTEQSEHCWTLAILINWKIATLVQILVKMLNWWTGIDFPGSKSL